MSALAKILHMSGKKVAGCDRCESDYTAALRNEGINVTIGNNVNFENFKVVVYTDALPESNAALIAARRQNKVIISRGRLLSALSSTCKKTVAVAGCHGKITCTAMLAHIFACAEVPFTSHIGGDDLTFSNAYSCGNDYFLTEACEYKKNFLYLTPDIAVVLNSDADHLDCYGSAENLKKAYLQFIGSAAQTVKLYGDLPEADGTTFGFDDRADYYAKKIRNVNGTFNFTVYEKGAELGKVSLSIYGKHNVLNALAATAAARLCGIEFDKISAGLSRFHGVKRRFERIGTHGGAVCIADYAHHPNEIKAALKTARLITGGELYVVFQPYLQNFRRARILRRRGQCAHSVQFHKAFVLRRLRNGYRAVFVGSQGRGHRAVFRRGRHLRHSKDAYGLLKLQSSARAFARIDKVGELLCAAGRTPAVDDCPTLRKRFELLFGRRQFKVGGKLVDNR